MEKTGYKKAISSVLLVFASALALVLAFTLYHLIINPKTAVYGAGSGDINISVQVDSSDFGPPRVDSIRPLTGPTSGGTLLIITGDYLDGVTDIYLNSGGLKCEPINYISKNEITCVMPAHDEGYVDITVISLGYGSDTKYNGFRYLDGGVIDIPGVPNTGLFRLGRYIITLYDILALVSIVTLGLGLGCLILWKRIHERETNKQH
ncbi:IPT/TIG domain-containing protein [Candidatus Saccharibacteria bacterium]|nr:IPT/TIG domain-containing protein [Candidatus Saccharibacteria bacterium]